jgi:hypothetical protein
LSEANFAPFSGAKLLLRCRYGAGRRFGEIGFDELPFGVRRGQPVGALAASEF